MKQIITILFLCLTSTIFAQNGDLSFVGVYLGSDTLVIASWDTGCIQSYKPIRITGGLLQGFAVEKGKDYFLGTSGTLTATKPTAAFTQKVGSWVEDSTLQLSIQQALPLIATGTYTQTVDKATTLTVTIPTQPNNNYRVFIIPKNELSAVLWRVPESGKTTTSFDITFNVAFTGLISGEVSFDWQVIQN